MLINNIWGCFCFVIFIAVIGGTLIISAVNDGVLTLDRQRVEELKKIEKV